MKKQPSTFDAWVKEIGPKEATKITGINKDLILELRYLRKLESKRLSTFIKIKEAIPKHWDLGLWFEPLKRL